MVDAIDSARHLSCMQHLKGEGAPLEAVAAELEKMGQPPESGCYSAAEIQQAVCTFRSAGVSRLADKDIVTDTIDSVYHSICLLQSSFLLLLSSSP